MGQLALAHLQAPVAGGIDVAKLKALTPPSKAQALFLERIAAGDSVTDACRYAKVDRVQFEIWRLEDEGFTVRLALAQQDRIDKAEQEAFRRAVDGVTDDVYYQGDVVGQKQIYSDGLLQFLLKGNRAEKYGDKVDLNAKIEAVSLVAVLKALPTVERELYAMESEGRVVQHQEGKQPEEKAEVGGGGKSGPVLRKVGGGGKTDRKRGSKGDT